MNRADPSAGGEVLNVVANPSPLDGVSEKKPASSVPVARLGHALAIVDHSATEPVICLLC